MAKTIVENYDGEKGYVGDDKFFVVRLNRKTYLVPQNAWNLSPWYKSDGSDIVAYRVIRAPRAKKFMNRAEAERVEDKATLATLVQKRTEDLEALE